LLKVELKFIYEVLKFCAKLLVIFKDEYVLVKYEVLFVNKLAK
jgi:hypothetical protein